MTTTYTLIVDIPEEEDRKVLRRGGYKLCIAKQVGDTFNVIWLANPDFKATSKYQWTEEYQVFGIDIFEDGAPVETMSDVEKIRFGQTCTLDADCEMSKAAGSPDESGIFKVDNQYGPIRFALNAKMRGKYSPIYISKPTIEGIIKFEPKAAVQVWFATKQATGTMFLETETKACKVMYAGHVVEKTVAYKGYLWEEMV